MEEIKNREYPQEMLLMGGCPNCGEEVNRDFVEKTIDEIIDLAVSKEREMVVDKAWLYLVKATEEEWWNKDELIKFINTK